MDTTLLDVSDDVVVMDTDSDNGGSPLSKQSVEEDDVTPKDPISLDEATAPPSADVLHEKENDSHSHPSDSGSPRMKHQKLDEEDDLARSEGDEDVGLVETAAPPRATAPIIDEENDHLVPAEVDISFDEAAAPPRATAPTIDDDDENDIVAPQKDVSLDETKTPQRATAHTNDGPMTSQALVYGVVEPGRMEIQDSVPGVVGRGRMENQDPVPAVGRGLGRGAGLRSPIQAPGHTTDMQQQEKLKARQQSFRNAKEACNGYVSIF